MSGASRKKVGPKNLLLNVFCVVAMPFCAWALITMHNRNANDPDFQEKLKAQQAELVRIQNLPQNREINEALRKRGEQQRAR